jgi:hypothetical protein
VYTSGIVSFLQSILLNPVTTTTKTTTTTKINKDQQRTTMRAIVICLVLTLFTRGISASESGVAAITTPDATECKWTQQWTAPSNFLCGQNTGLGCELANYKHGALPIEITFVDSNRTQIETCSANSNAMPTIVTIKEGDAIILPLNFTCQSSKKVSVRINSPCFQNSKFQYGTRDEGDMFIECGRPNPTDGKEQLSVSVATDHYKYGLAGLGAAHPRGVLNIHSATCSFASEGTIEISEGSNVTFSNKWVLVMLSMLAMLLMV